MKKIKLFFYCIVYLLPHLTIAKTINYINSQPVIGVNELLKIRQDIQYTQLSDSFEVYREKIPLVGDKTWWLQDPIIFPQKFVLSMPHGRVFSQEGLVIVNGMYVDEFIWKPTKECGVLPLQNVSKLGVPKKIKGKVAVITQGGSWNYYHWLVEVLPRLFMLEESKIAYDYLYLPLCYGYMKETIELLEIDKSIIIEPIGVHQYIQADELIALSPPSAYGYTSEFVINFLQDTFIPLAKKSINFDRFAKKVFISRRKATCRKIKNEDDIFALFQIHGFVRYDLEDLSFLEQVALFYNAEIIVGEHGAGLTNMMFMQSGTHVVEIFQARARAMYWYLSQELGLKYTCVKTMDFEIKRGGNSQSIVPLEPIQDVINKLSPL